MNIISKERGDHMFDSYELTDYTDLMYTRYYRRFFWDLREYDMRPEPIPSPFWRNLEWLKMRLNFDGIQYDKCVKRPKPDSDRCTREHGGKVYDLRSAEDTIMLYNAITGKNETWMTAEDYAKQLKERRMEHERECSNLGRN